MNWFKKAQTEPEKLLSRQEFEDMVQRVFNRHREYLKEDNIHTWRQWLQESTPYELSLVLESDFDIYDRYLHDLPEGTMAIDLIKLYKENKLSTQPSKIRDFTPIAIEPTPTQEATLPWQTRSFEQLDSKAAQLLYSKAIQRVTSSNRDEITNARKQIYFAFNSDKELAEKIGISPTELNRRIRQYSGLRMTDKRTEDRLNENIPVEHQWTGITNSTFLGRTKIDSQDLDQFVKEIIVTNEGQNEYTSYQGQTLRTYVANTLLAIDTKVDYHDLAFEIGRIKKSTTRGQYSPRDNKITISDLNRHTVAHELGHYLDYKFARQYDDQYTPLSASVRITHHLPEQHQQWIRKYKSFVQRIMDRSDIHSAYSQSPAEVFARFIDKFVSWVDRTNQQWNWHDTYGDKFNMADFHLFVRLLQEKSYIDAAFPLKEGT